MATLFVTTREGETRSLAAAPGFSVMEVIRDGGIDELLAACGGSLSCATCHVIVDPAQAMTLPPASEAERDLLEGLDHLTPTSRLSCQIAFEPQYDGLSVTIAPEA
ncbi:2Fe-2S iron-sulfur cluster-binding protein [Sphingomonas sp. DT-51]|uniref:2Fe-2S iron-sulfur cluster-binding protein n=1 Tax=Sphingomonas sp. DT-51 TaxID=3396165 RepID=UPI003F1ACBB0